jgi:hypothetical protein
MDPDILARVTVFHSLESRFWNFRIIGGNNWPSIRGDTGAYYNKTLTDSFRPGLCHFNKE